VPGEVCPLFGFVQKPEYDPDSTSFKWTEEHTKVMLESLLPVLKDHVTRDGSVLIYLWPRDHGDFTTGIGWTFYKHRQSGDHGPDWIINNSYANLREVIQ
jgi:hypothetical protein